MWAHTSQTKIEKSRAGLAQVAAMLPLAGKGKRITILTGVRTPNGRVQLEAVRLGGRRLASKEEASLRMRNCCKIPRVFPMVRSPEFRAAPFTKL